MAKIKRIVGMAWATPVVRTATQAGLMIVVGSGLNFVDVSVWKSAALAAGAAFFAKLQEVSRA